jgi:hypothetical protein
MRTTNAAALAVWLVAAAAEGGEYHYEGMPVGARAAGMAGAFTAVANDSSAALYNPAGMVQSRGTEFSLSTNAYALVEERVSGSDARQPASFRAFPSTFAVIKTPFFVDKDDPAPRHRYGFSILVTDSTTLSRISTADGAPIRLTRESETTTLYGISHSFRIAEDWMIGASAYLVERELVRFESAAHPLADGEFRLFRRELEGGHYSARLLAGVLWRPSNRFALGMTLRTPTRHLYGKLTLNELVKEPGVALEERTSERGLLVHRLPAGGTIGVSARPFTRLLVSIDVNAHAAAGRYRALQTEDLEEWVDKKAVVNAALGAELTVAEHVPLRAGFFTDRSSQRAAGGGMARPLDLYAVTLSSGYETERAAIVLGGAYRFGATPGPEGLERRELRWWIAGSYRL